MSGWLAMIGLALAAALGLGFFLRRDKGALQFMGAALLLALAGYSWQGRPDQPGAPKQAPERQPVPETAFDQTREDTFGRFNRAASWLNMAESFQQRGDHMGAAQLLQGAAQRHPRDVALWIGLGNALVLHGGGMMSPAAQLAFQRAAELAPDHPAPLFFYAEALAQSGNYGEAERIWRQLATRTDLPAEIRTRIEQNLSAIGEARATGRIPPAGPPQQAAPPAPAR
jgi:cytochrome c-type biogenesis protein CcmH